MRERQRVRLAERQILLARVARREAMSALAGTIAEEARSAALAQRSRALIDSYAARAETVQSDDLRERITMAGALARLAADAERARAEAERRAGNEADTLADSENRLKRLEEHAHKARRTLAGIEQARELYAAQQVAQKLLRPGQTKSGSKL
jgi:hypothetical protein